MSLTVDHICTVVLNFQMEQELREYMGVWNLQHLSSLRGQDNTLADVFCINLTGKSSSSSERAYGEVVEVGVVPSWMVSASVNLPLHHEVQKFSSGTGSSRWSRKSRKMVVVWCGVSLEVLVKFMQKTSTNMSLADVPIFCLVWKNKPNATKAHIHQSKEMYNNIKQTQKKLKPGSVASYDIRPGNGWACSGFGDTYQLTQSP